MQQNRNKTKEYIPACAGTGLGVGSEGAAGEKNMHDAEFTCALFRFIQLTCEGHNLGKPIEDFVFMEHFQKSTKKNKLNFSNVFLQSGKTICEHKLEIRQP